MTLYELRSDILLIAQMLKLSKDTRFYDRQVDFMIREHRARAIREEYGRNGFIDPSWLQDFGEVDVTPVNSGDDPAILRTSMKLGKIVIPTVVSIPGDKGVYRVSGSSKMGRYYYSELDYLMSIEPGSISSRFKYYCRVGTAGYLSPCTEQANMILILDDPMDGYVLNTTFVTELTIGDVFKVYDAQIIHDGIPYNPGQTFTAVNKTFSGNGRVKYNNQKRKMTDRDPYPMSLTLFEYIVMKIFTEDLMYSRQTIADIINDSQDQLVALQNAETTRSRQTKQAGA